MEERSDFAGYESIQESLESPASAPRPSSDAFIGQWNRLVSHTNWEKGRIIQQWRETLEASGAPASEYSDEAWSRMVGGVTPQHVGRLRRVYQRFGSTYDQYEGLYWSHFFAALEWNDAEMWLEGAVQNRWSISAMRSMRAEALGEVAEAGEYEQPTIADVDEDFEPLVSVESAEAAEEEAAARDAEDRVTRARGEEELEVIEQDEPMEDASDASEEPAPVRPFAELPDLPEDLAEAFDAFKIAILHHKTQQWRDVACDDVLASLDALKALATAP